MELYVFPPFYTDCDVANIFTWVVDNYSTFTFIVSVVFSTYDRGENNFN